MLVDCQIVKREEANLVVMFTQLIAKRICHLI